MTNAPSVLSLSASGLYGFVLAACLLAAATAVQHRQMPAHARTWLALAAFFVLLALLRIFAVEEMLRDHLRDALRASGGYRERRSFQAPIVAAVLVITASICGFFLYRWVSRVRGRRNVMLVVAVVCALAMAFLLALRLTSLHMVDALLYGPLKLSWVGDLGASLAVLFAAVNYVRLVRSRP